MNRWIVFFLLVAAVFATEETPCPANQCLVYSTDKATPICVPCNHHRLRGEL